MLTEYQAEGIDRPSIDKSKGPMENIMWSFMRSSMVSMTSMNDTHEKIANALDPSPPFTTSMHRFRFAMVLVPLIAVSITVSADTLFGIATFSLGALFFGRPVLQGSRSWLERNNLHWLEAMSIDKYATF